MHELSHNLASKSLLWNRVLGLLSNLPLGLPSYATFKRYHLEHHKYQGEDGIDVDVPTTFEGHFFVGPVLKTIWCFLQPFFYALRFNWLVQLVVDGLVWYYWGFPALGYILLSSLLGLGMHPMAGHFFAEHYTFVTSQETYSYYGPLNWFSFNVGYHNEHHDFPNVPGTHLPDVRAVSHAAYDDLPTHSSWIKVIWRYITNPTITPFNRVKRNTMGGAVDLD
ncbi:degs1 [Symbiodinium sp. KB8]|nr:degs1 [Symbiodinium sp. KB8]